MTWCYLVVRSVCLSVATADLLVQTQLHIFVTNSFVSLLLKKSLVHYHLYNQRLFAVTTCTLIMLMILCARCMYIELLVDGQLSYHWLAFELTVLLSYGVSFVGHIYSLRRTGVLIVT